MSDKPNPADWRSFAHSVEVLAAAAAAKHGLEGSSSEAAGPPSDWLNFAHSVDVLSASAAASQDLQSAWPANTVSLASVRAATAQRTKTGQGWRQVAERPLMSALSAAAAVLLIAVFASSPNGIFHRHGDPELAKAPLPDQPTSIQVAVADLPAGTQALIERLRCRAGQDCWPTSSNSSVIRGVGSDPAQRRPIVTRTRSGRDDIEARAQAGDLPVADIEFPFARDSAELPLSAKAQLDAIGETVKRSGNANGRANFAIIGDAAASEKDAAILAQRRAKAVADYLITTLGISAGQLDAFGRGKGLNDQAAPSLFSNRSVRLVNLGHVLD